MPVFHGIVVSLKPSNILSFPKVCKFTYLAGIMNSSYKLMMMMMIIYTLSISSTNDISQTQNYTKQGRDFSHCLPLFRVKENLLSKYFIRMSSVTKLIEFVITILLVYLITKLLYIFCLCGRLKGCVYLINKLDGPCQYIQFFKVEKKLEHQIISLSKRTPPQQGLYRL